MAVVSMSKIGILLHKEYKAEALELLQKEGVMEIVENTEGCNEVLENNHKIDLEIAEINFALNFLKKYAPSYGGMEGMLLGEKTKISSFQDIEKIRNNFVYKDTVEECKNIEESFNKIQLKIAENKQNIELLTPWNNFDVNLKEDLETKTSKLIVGFLKPTLVEKCLLEFESNFVFGDFQIVEELSDKVACCFLVELKDLRDMEAFLQKHEFTEFILPKLNGTPKEILAELNKKQETLENDILKLTQRHKETAKNVPELKVIYDYLIWLKGKEEIKNQFFYTNTTVSIQGFIPQKKLTELKKELEKIDKTVFLEKLEITKTDNVPVALQNSNFVKPFEGVMKLFGLPSSNELDPTPYLTPFFLIFFGFCLTDVGYGLILALGTLALLKFVKFPADMKNMLRLLMYAGWATVIMGVLFGGYLGLTVDQVPAWMVNAETGLFKLQVFDPINNLNTVMAFAYGLGLVQLWLGILLKGINTSKTSNWKAFQTSYIFNVLIILAIFLALAKSEILFPAFANVLEYIVYACIAFAIWGSGYGQKNIIVRPLIGIIVFIQEIINVFSAVLSYSRLFALGLATGIIALVFNTIAITTLDLLPIYIAIPMMIIIILLGHLLNIALNVLGAFIHSARLQFVEFFGKFLEGGGKEYAPFKRDMKYIVLEKD